MIFMPPGSGKSVYATKLFPAWHLAQHPDHQVICASHTVELAQEFGRTTRNFIQENGPALGYTISADTQAAGRWNTDKDGGYFAVGVGGAVVGRRADLAIIDDPVSGAEDADAKPSRDRLWNWYQQEFYTRLKPGARTIIIMTRWHSDDIAGRLLNEMQKGGDKWEILRLPAIAEDNDPLGRERGEPLWPEWEDLAALERKKRAVGSRTWAAQFQGRPTVEEGGIFKRDWVQMWEWDWELPAFDYIVQSYDTAFTERTTGDPSACVVLGVFKMDPVDSDDTDRPWQVMLLDCWSDHLSYPELRERMVDEWKSTYGAGQLLNSVPQIGPKKQALPGRRPDMVLIEHKGSGISLMQDLSKTRIPVRAYNPGKADKVARAHMVTPMVEAGRLWVPEAAVTRDGKRMQRLADDGERAYANWAQPMLNQLFEFPNAPHDDFVDCITQALRVLSDMRFVVLDDEDPHDPDFDDYREPEEYRNPYAA